MNEIQIFQNVEFGAIRTLSNEQGEPMFCAKDVAEALGYSNGRDAVRKHVDGEDKTTVAICDTGSNYKSQAIFINESGLYSLILSSKLESAKRFKHWVNKRGTSGHPQAKRSVHALCRVCLPRLRQESHT